MQTTLRKLDDSCPASANFIQTKEFFLNDYQLFLLRLSYITPYNAVHVIDLNPKNLSLNDLVYVIQNTLTDIGLGIPKFNAPNLVQFIVDPSFICLKEVSEPISQYVDKEMNRPFAPNELPIRFALLSYQGITYFILTYNHWIADAYAISRLAEIILMNNRVGCTTHFQLSDNKMEQFFPFYEK